MGLREIIISAILVGLIVVCLFGFANQSAIDNSANRSIMDDTAITKAFSNMTSAVNQAYPTATSQLNASAEEQPSLAFGSLVMFSIVGAGRIFTGTLTTIYQIFFVLIAEQLQVPTIVMNTFMAIILITIIFFVWRTIRIGS